MLAQFSLVGAAAAAAHAAQDAWTQCFLHHYQAVCDSVFSVLGFVYRPFDLLATSLEMEPTQVRFIACMLASIFVSGYYRFIRSPVQRDIFSILVGLVFLYVVFARDANHLLFVLVFSYLTMHWHRFTVVFAILYLSFCHIYRLRVAYMSDEVDFSAPMMILILKVISTACNVKDGRHAAPPRPTSKISVAALPPFVEYAAYCLIPSTVLAGPVFDFVRYREFRGGQHDESFRFKRFMQKMTFVFITIVSHFIGARSWPRELLYPANFNQLSFWEKHVRVWVVVAFYRARYHLVWYLAELSILFAGLGGVCQADWVGTEFALSIQDISNRWNYGVAQFLQRYVYFRLAPPGRKAGWMSNLAVFAMSAVWHGFYGGYYLFFLSGPLIMPVVKQLRRVRVEILEPLFELIPVIGLGVVYVYRGLAILATSWALTWFGATFVLLDFDLGFNVWKETWFLGHVLLAAGFMVSFVLLKLRKFLLPRHILEKQAEERRKKREAAAALKGRKSE